MLDKPNFHSHSFYSHFPWLWADNLYTADGLKASEPMSWHAKYRLNRLIKLSERGFHWYCRKINTFLVWININLNSMKNPLKMAWIMSVWYEQKLMTKTWTGVILRLLWYDTDYQMKDQSKERDSRSNLSTKLPTFLFHFVICKFWSLVSHRLVRCKQIFMHYSIRCTLNRLPPPFLTDPSFEMFVCDRYSSNTVYIYTSLYFVY